MLRWKYIAGFTVVMVLVLTAYSLKAIAKPLPTLRPKTTLNIESQKIGSIDLSWPSYGQAAIGAVGYDVLDSHNDVQPLPTASTTKLMTALAVLSKHPLSSGQQGPIITLTQKDVDIYNYYQAQNGSTVRVNVGENITEYQALQAMLIPSANNMADSLAEWAFGSLDAYENYANAYARHLGMDNSHFSVDASGFDPHTVSTASDLVRLGEAAIQDPVIAEIVRQTSAQIPVVGEVTSTNHLLGIGGMIGIKTGNNDQDKGAYIFASNFQLNSNTGITIIGAIMGGPSLDRVENDSLNLLTSSRNGFSTHQIITAGTVVGQYFAPWGKSSVAVAQNDLSVITWQDQKIETSLNLEPITPPLNSNESVGDISIKVGNVIKRDPVLLKNTIEPPDLKWRLLTNLK